ncbi:MAG: hypothetical protein JSS07_11495 [Proteobacteria bacterium]|nr:hypothetical protein [Pseudomonadota bacterium]
MATNKCLLRFKDLFNRTNDIAAALKEVINLYLDELKKNQKPQSDPKDSDLEPSLKEFIKHLESASIGNIIIDYDFKLSSIPEDLTEIFYFAKMFEKTAKKSVSHLVVECKNTLAAENESPRAAYLQLVRIDKEAQLGKIEKRYVEEVNELYKGLQIILHQRVAKLILKVKNFPDLNSAIATAFPEEECKEFKNVSAVRNTFLVQIQFLETRGFFADFYASESLADKFDCLGKYYHVFAQEKILKEHLKLILCYLFEQIIDDAYLPCDLEMHEIMSKSEGTIAEVFSALGKWSKTAWKPFEQRQILKELSLRSKKIYDDLMTWQEISNLETGQNQPKPMYQLFCMKYTYDPNQDPKKELEYIRQQKQERQICNLDRIKKSVSII